MDMEGVADRVEKQEKLCLNRKAPRQALAREVQTEECRIPAGGGGREGEGAPFWRFIISGAQRSYRASRRANVKDQERSQHAGAHSRQPPEDQATLCPRAFS